MPQNYTPIDTTAGGDTVRQGFDKVKQHDAALKSHFAGTSFPSQNLVVGMLCYRTDQNQLYQLTDDDPIAWKAIPHAPVPVVQGGTGGTTPARARQALQVPSQEELQTAKSTAATELATVKRELMDIINGLTQNAPAALDTLQEIARAINDNSSVARTLRALINTKITQTQADRRYAQKSQVGTMAGYDIVVSEDQPTERNNTIWFKI